MTANKPNPAILPLASSSRIQINELTNTTHASRRRHLSPTSERAPNTPTTTTHVTQPQPLINNKIQIIRTTFIFAVSRAKCLCFVFSEFHASDPSLRRISIRSIERTVPAHSGQSLRGTTTGRRRPKPNTPPPPPQTSAACRARRRNTGTSWRSRWAKSRSPIWREWARRWASG